MGLKIHDFCAVRIRCLVIVEIICLIFFAAGCTGKTVEGVKEDFPFETVQLASEYGTLYIQASSYSEEIGKEILQQFDTDVETAVQRTGCGGADVLLCIADSATASYTRMRTSGIVLLSRYKAALTARGFWKSFTICMITARLSDWPVLFMILKARVPISKRTTQMRTTYLCFLCLRHIL